MEAYIFIHLFACQLSRYIFGGGAINANVCVSVCFLNGRGDVLKSHKVPFVLPKEADNQHEAKDYVNHCPSRF